MLAEPFKNTFFPTVGQRPHYEKAPFLKIFWHDLAELSFVYL